MGRLDGGGECEEGAGVSCLENHEHGEHGEHCAQVACELVGGLGSRKELARNQMDAVDRVGSNTISTSTFAANWLPCSSSFPKTGLWYSLISHHQGPPSSAIDH